MELLTNNNEKTTRPQTPHQRLALPFRVVMLNRHRRLMFQLIDEPDACRGEEAKRNHLQSKANYQDMTTKICFCGIVFRRCKQATACGLNQECDHITRHKNPSYQVRR